jgi:hypothetical protein
VYTSRVANFLRFTPYMYFRWGGGEGGGGAEGDGMGACVGWVPEYELGCMMHSMGLCM